MNTIEITTTTCPRSTPWGRADHVKMMIPGMWRTDTPSHGGIYVAPERHEAMPEYMRESAYSGGGWYEEDVDWCIPVLVFWSELDGKEKPETHTAALDTLKNWHPDKFERFFNVTLQPGESFVRDEEVFNKTHANDWIVISAFGDWHEHVPNGFVGVCARIGGRTRANGSEKSFIVPKAEYDGRGKHGFVVDPTKHIEVKEEF